MPPRGRSRPGTSLRKESAVLDGAGSVRGRGAPHTAFTYDVGGFLELTLLPLLDLGVHGGYDRIASGNSIPAFEFAIASVHVAAVF